MLLPCAIALAGVCFPIGSSVQTNSGPFGRWATVTGPGFTAQVEYSTDSPGLRTRRQVCNPTGCVDVDAHCTDGERPSCKIGFWQRPALHSVWISASSPKALAETMASITFQVGPGVEDERLPLSRLVEAEP